MDRYLFVLVLAIAVAMVYAYMCWSFNKRRAYQYETAKEALKEDADRRRRWVAKQARETARRLAKARARKID